VELRALPLLSLPTLLLSLPTLLLSSVFPSQAIAAKHEELFTESLKLIILRTGRALALLAFETVLHGVFPRDSKDVQ
jgi:hypothetical protein